MQERHPGPAVALDPPLLPVGGRVHRRRRLGDDEVGARPRASSRGQSSKPYGGSAKARSTSNRGRHGDGVTDDDAGAVARARASAMFSSIAASAARSRSTNVQCAAPRESASMPSAPLPAYRSATAASTTTSRLARALNTASRTLSVVGLVASAGGATSRRPRNSPATTRTAGRLRRRRCWRGGPDAARTGSRHHVHRLRRSGPPARRRRDVDPEDADAERWQPGDIVTYRCEDCLDRWDLVLDDDDP